MPWPSSTDGIELPTYPVTLDQVRGQTTYSSGSHGTLKVKAKHLKNPKTWIYTKRNSEVDWIPPRIYEFCC